MKGKLTWGALAGIVVGSTPVLPMPEWTVDFEPGSDHDLQWRVVNDGVMGGLSEGTVALTETGELVFVGNLSLENNGGFSSIRTNRVSFDLSRAEGLALRVKGDGRTYQLRLSNSRTYRGRESVFMAEFPTTKGEWTDVRIPFDRFVGTWFGRLIPDARLDPSDISRLGILLADKNAGAFALGVDHMRTYGEAAETLAGDSTAENSVAGVNRDDLREALQLIESAISTGVPIFNSGQHARTAEIYADCLVELARSPSFDPDGTSQLERVIEQGKELANPTDRAWFYRRALDASARALLDAMG